MYAFVRITAVIIMLLGILIMIAGVVTTVVGAMALVENAPPAGMALPMFNSQYVSIAAGAIILFQGLVVTALGQLMLVIVDISRATQETALQLRALRRTE